MCQIVMLKYGYAREKRMQRYSLYGFNYMMRKKRKVDEFEKNLKRGEPYTYLPRSLPLH